MEVVLELAHKIDESIDVRDSVPSKDRIVDQLIFRLPDIVMISAMEVEMNYALKGWLRNLS